MEPVRFGVVGVGGMGGNHAKGFANLEEATLVAVADVDGDTSARVAAETGATTYASAEELIEKGDVEAVIIATPHFFHPTVAMLAASRGIHVLSEKPVAVTVSAADAMVQAAEAAGTLLGVVFQQRTEPLRLKMKAMIDGGELGEIHRVAIFAPWYRPQAYYAGSAWRGTWKGEGGGILMNQAPHTFDQFAWLGGSPKSVQAIATTRLHDIEVENTGIAIFDYGNGKVGSFYASTAEVPGSERFEIAGDGGILQLADGKLNFFQLEQPLAQHLTTETEMFAKPKGAWRTIEVEETPSGHLEVTRAFARAIRANDPTLMVADGREGVRALELANAVLLAGFTRKQVDFPLDRAAVDHMLKLLQDGVRPADLAL